MLPNTATMGKDDPMKRSVAVVSGMVLLAILCWAFPPVHVRSRKTLHAAQAGAQFSVTNFVADFWRNKLLAAADHATEASKILEAIALGPQKAREQFSRSVELGGTYYLFLRGTGRVVSLSDDSLGISLKPEGNAADLCIPLGLVFGNAPARWNRSAQFERLPPILSNSTTSPPV